MAHIELFLACQYFPIMPIMNIPHYISSNSRSEIIFNQEILALEQYTLYYWMAHISGTTIL